METGSQKGQSVIEVMLVLATLLACVVVETPKLMKAFDEIMKEASLPKDER